jgi:hypothetical protein
MTGKKEEGKIRENKIIARAAKKFRRKRFLNCLKLYQELLLKRDHITKLS